MTTVEVLTKARDLVARPGGWEQGHWPDDACCALIAINRAAGHGGNPLEAMRVFRRVIRTKGIARWNDKPGRKQATVVRAFDRAIALVAAEASHE